MFKIIRPAVGESLRLQNNMIYVYIVFFQDFFTNLAYLWQGVAFSRAEKQVQKNEFFGEGSKQLGR